MFKFLFIKSEEIKKGVVILAVFTLLSQLLALVRENIFSKVVGAGIDLDLYNASFRITDILFLLSATLISTFVLIPILNKKEFNDEKNNLIGTEKSQTKIYINKVFTTFFVYLSVLLILFIIFTPQIISLIFSKYSGEDLEKFITITRMALIAPFFMSIANIFISINQIKHYFLPYALMSILNNLSIIFATYFLYPIYGLKGMIFGVVLGGVLYFSIHLPTILKEKMFPRFTSFLTFSEIVKIFSISLPRTIGIFSASLMIIYITSKVSLLGDGYISYFNWAFMLSTVPSGFLGMAYSVAAFPKLSKLFIQEKYDEFSNEISKVFKSIIYFGAPITLFFVIFSKDLVSLIYWTKKISFENMQLVSISLSILSLSILFQSFNFVLTRAFFAIENTKIPFMVNIIGLIFLVFSGNLVFSGIITDFSIEEKFFIISALYSFVFLLISIFLFILLKAKLLRIEWSILNKELSDSWLLKEFRFCRIFKSLFFLFIL